MTLYLVPSGPMQTTGSFATLALSAATIKSILQVKPFNLARVVEWGCSFDNNVANVPVQAELIEVDVAATVTASVDADITKYGNVADTAAASVAGLTLGTSATGYNASVEGSITATRNLDAPVLVPPTQPWFKQYPLGRESIIQLAKFARIRLKAPSAVNCYGYMVLDI